MVDRIKRNLLKLGLFSSLVPFLSSIKTAYAKTSFFDEFVAIKANHLIKLHSLQALIILFYVNGEIYCGTILKRKKLGIFIKLSKTCYGRQ